MGPHANFERSTRSRRKVIAVQMLRPGRRSMIPAARTGAMKGEVMGKLP
jgi:hypothetical protein